MTKIELATYIVEYQEDNDYCIAVKEYMHKGFGYSRAVDKAIDWYTRNHRKAELEDMYCEINDYEYWCN